MSFVNVPAATIADTLVSKGYVANRVGNEVVYDFTHRKNASYFVRVYSSVKTGSEVARACGQDAIRIVLLRKDSTGKVWGVAKATKVLRTGTVEKVVDRLLGRCREMYAVANATLSAPSCACCGGPVWEDSSRCKDWRCRQNHGPAAVASDSFVRANVEAANEAAMLRGDDEDSYHEAMESEMAAEMQLF